MIKIQNLSKSFSNKKVIEGLNVTIEEGEIFGLVGINGSGKSTLLRLISGVYKADEGSILIDGEEVYENEDVKSKIFFLPDEPFYDHNTTPLSLIDFYDTFYGVDKDIYINNLIKYQLPLSKGLKNFSKGMKRQVFICLALAIKPKYLLLDEAFDGLDPLARLAFKKELKTLLEEKKTTLIVSSHSLKELNDFCTSYGIIDNMKIISNADIVDEKEKLHKYQFVVEDEIKDLDAIRISNVGRVVNVITYDDLKTFEEKINKYKPLFIEEIDVSFEDLFLIEVESKGYLG